MKKILLIVAFTLTAGCWAQEDDHSAKNWMKKAIPFVAKTPLVYFHNGLITMIDEFVNEAGYRAKGGEFERVGLQPNNLELTFNFILLKLKMPSTTALEKEELLKDINEYLEGGILSNIIAFFQPLSDEREDAQQIIKMAQLILDKLNRLKQELEVQTA